MVVGQADMFDRIAVAQIGELPARSDGSGARCKSAVERHTCFELSALVSDIGDFEAHVVTELPLHRQIPLLDVGHSRMRIEDDGLYVGRGGSGGIKGEEEVMVSQSRYG